MNKYSKNYYKLVIPVKPDSINRVVKYGKKEGDIVHLKRKWEKITMRYIERFIDDEILPIRFKGVIGVHFKLYFETNRERDGDNYSLMCKGMLDAFVAQNMLPDDNYHYVEDNGRRLIVDSERPRVEVYITEKIPADQVVSLKDYGKYKEQYTNNKRAD